MLARRATRLRLRGATAVETAVVIPVVLLLILGTFIIGMGIYYYQQVATLAREGARYASVHGSQYAHDFNGDVNLDDSDIYDNAIKPMAVGLDPSKLNYQVQWGTAVSGSWVWTSWDSSKPDPTSYVANPASGPAGGQMYNAVKVKVTYQWTPGLYLTGSFNLTSTSVMPMSY